ncbi:unnamed protein product, partial [Polarella glacialis]
VISLFPGMDSRGVAEIVCVAVRIALPAASTPGGSESALAAGMFSASVRDSWNDPNMPSFQQLEESAARGDVTNVIAAVKESVADVNWAEVFDMIFDLPELQLGDQRSCQALLSAQKSAQGAAEPFPLAAVLRLRRNTSAQLKFLRFAMSTQSGVDFASCPPLLEP